MLFIFSDRRLSKEPEAQHVIFSLTAIDLKRIGIRCVIVAISFLCGSYFLWQDEVMDVFVGVSDTVTRQYKEVHCSADYMKERAMFGGKSSAFFLLREISFSERRLRNNFLVPGN